MEDKLKILIKKVIAEQFKDLRAKANNKTILNLQSGTTIKNYGLKIAPYTAYLFRTGAIHMDDQKQKSYISTCRWIDKNVVLNFRENKYEKINDELKNKLLTTFCEVGNI